jgi:hypothetical protein
MMSGEGGSRVHDHRSYLSHNDRPGLMDRGDSVLPNESASHHGGDSPDPSAVASIPPSHMEDMPFPFKFKAPSGRVHRLQVVVSAGIEELIHNVAKKTAKFLAVVSPLAILTTRVIPSPSPPTTIWSKLSAYPVWRIARRLTFSYTTPTRPQCLPRSIHNLRYPSPLHHLSLLFASASSSSMRTTKSLDREAGINQYLSRNSRRSLLVFQMTFSYLELSVY